MNCSSCNAENVENARFCAKCGAVMPATAEEEKDPFIGQKLGGRYVVKRMLGEGGMGRVYEAERGMAGEVQRIAIKTLHAHLSRDEQTRARFNRECATMVKLKHPNTIRVEDFGEAPDGTLYIAMEFVDGTNVSKEIETNGPMSPDRVERILDQVCGSLSEAHKAGIIHRDLKPENVVLTNVGDDTDVVKVLDFGIAARKDKTDTAKEQKLTQQGMVLGTPPYMSPEQFTGKELDARSDIYSLGVMAYEMLTGRLPFDASTPWEWATQHLSAQPFPFEDSPTVTDIPGKMKTAILRALSKNPAGRQDSARAFLEELRSGEARRLTSPGLDSAPHPPNPGATAAMQPYESDKGRTQVGTPIHHPSIPGVESSLPPGGGMMGPPGGMGPVIPVPVAPMTSPAPPNNKGLIFGLMGLVGFGLLIIVGLIAKSAFKKSGSDETLTPITGSSATGPATVAPLPSGGVPPVDTTTLPKLPTTSTAAGTSTGTSKPATSKLTGEEACNDARRRATGGDITGAMAPYQNCSGPDKDNTRRVIAASVPGAVRTSVFRGDCKGARANAAAGSQVGAPSINVDQQYPQCKGK
jgi:serine/threonine-protein kinase